MQAIRRAYNFVNRARMLGLHAMVFVLGVVGVVLGGWYAWHAVDVLRTGDRVDARVESVRETTDDPPRYEPTYAYRVDGETYWYELTNPSLKERPDIGDRRELLVAADDPRDARIPNGWGLWATPIILLLFGAGCFWALYFRLVLRR